MFAFLTISFLEFLLRPYAIDFKIWPSNCSHISASLSPSLPINGQCSSSTTWMEFPLFFKSILIFYKKNFLTKYIHSYCSLLSHRKCFWISFIVKRCHLIFFWQNIFLVSLLIYSLQKSFSKGFLKKVIHRWNFLKLKTHA